MSSRIGTRRASGTSSASRPPTTCRPWPAPSLSRSWARGACSSSRTADPYFGTDVATAARNLGLEIVGSTKWNAEARSYERLARRIARTRADAVFIGGFLYPNGGALVRDLRARLGPDVALCRPRLLRPRPGSDRGRRAGGARDVPQRLRRAERRAPTRGQAVPRGVRSHPSRRAEPVVLRRVRRPGGRDPARRDRPLRRHALVGDARASPDDQSRTASSGTSASTRTATSWRGR